MSEEGVVFHKEEQEDTAKAIAQGLLCQHELLAGTCPECWDPEATARLIKVGVICQHWEYPGSCEICRMHLILMEEGEDDFDQWFN